MKRILIGAIMLCVSICANAQITTTSSCDTNNDGDVTISDVTNTANKVLGKVAAETQVVTAEQLNTILSEINAKLDKLERLETWAKSISAKLGAQTPEEYEDSIACNGHAYVDLGLTSGTKWATMNVGATTAEGYGDYFAWGETTGYNSGKTTFSWSTYTLCNGSSSTMTKYCTDSDYGTVDNQTELLPADDAAHVNWGGDWVMPSKTQQDELRTECTWTWTTQSSVKGYKVTGTNGNSIFLPAAGCRNSSSLYNAGSYGYYWSRTLDSSSSYYAYSLLFNSSDVYWSSYNRCCGRSVRPVLCAQN